VSRPEQSGGRVTATEKKMIACGRLSPTKEESGGCRAHLIHVFADDRSVRRTRSRPWKSPRTGSRAQRSLPGPGKTKVTSAGGSCLSPRSGRQARPGGRKGAPSGRTGARVNRPTGRCEARHRGRLQPRGRAGEYWVAAVHKAGEERRFGATPATATPPPSSSARHGSTTMATIPVSQARVCGHCRDGTVVVAACPVSGRFGQLTVTEGCRKSGCGAGVFLPAARVLIFRFGHTRRCPRLRALRVSGLAGTATPNAMGVLTFRFGDKLSRPRLRPLRSPVLAGTAPQPATGVLTFRFGDRVSRPRLRPFRVPGLTRTARMSGWLVLTFRFGHTRRCPCLRPLRTPGLAGTAPPIAFRDRSPTDGRSLALAASGREGRRIRFCFSSTARGQHTW